MANWWYVVDEQRNGPTGKDTLRKLLQQGTITPDSLVWREGLDSWVPLRCDAALAVLLKTVPPPLPPPGSPAVQEHRSPLVEIPSRDLDSASVTDALALVSAREQRDDTSKPATAWSRFCARLFDVWLGGWIVSAVLLATGLAWPGALKLSPLINLLLPFILPFIILLAAMILEALPYALFGNTAGKALLGITVASENGGRLGTWQYLDRNVSMWVSGLCVGIPLLSFVTMGTQATRLRKGEQASYDAGKYRPLQRRASVVRWIVFVMLFFILLILHVVLNQIGDYEANRIVATGQQSGRAASANQKTPAAVAPIGDSLGVAAAGAADCAREYYGGAAPAIINPRLATGTVKLCYQGFDVMYSTVTRMPIWSAERLYKFKSTFASHLDYWPSVHEEERLSAVDRATDEDFAGSKYVLESLTAPSGLASVEARNGSVSYANMVLLENANVTMGWNRIAKAVLANVQDDGAVYVIRGTLFEGESVNQLNGRVIVPTGLYIAYFDEKRGVASAYILDNDELGRTRKATLAEIERRAGVNLFPALSAALKKARASAPPT